MSIDDIWWSRPLGFAIGLIGLVMMLCMPVYASMTGRMPPGWYCVLAGGLFFDGMLIAFMR